jgi:hypothetical protein
MLEFGYLIPGDFPGLYPSGLWVDSTVPEKGRMNTFVPEGEKRDVDQPHALVTGDNGS